jgi:glycosyltransferase involved in cell wall biosynthesis
VTVLVVVPVLRRPHRAEPLAASLAAATPEPHRLLFVCTEGDADEIAACRAIGADVLTIDHRPEDGGDYAIKTNAAVSESTEPRIFTGADDLHFHPGWLPAATARLTDGIGVVGTNDLGSPRVVAGDHATHSLVTRTYAAQGTADQPAAVFHEGYFHNFVDDELVGTAKARGAWAFAADSHVEHLHPHWNRSIPRDAVYDLAQGRFERDRRLFRRRRHLWEA